MSESLLLESPVLILDAAAPVVHVGLEAGDTAHETNRATVWRQARGEAGTDLFRLVEEALREARLTVADLRTIVFCEGPGSLLGVRLVAIALRTWAALPRPTPLRVRGYRSLALLAAQLLAGGTPPPFHVVSDARRATWNLLTVDAAGSIGAIRRWPAAGPLPGGAVFHPLEFPHWQSLPAGATGVPYDPAALPALARRFSLLQPVEQPDAFLTEAPAYRTWSPAAEGPAATA